MLKKEVRVKNKTKRLQYSNLEVLELSQRLSALLFSELDFSTVEHAHVFIPIEKFKEVDTWTILRKLWKHYPSLHTCTSITNFEENELEHVFFNSKTTFEDDKWGIPTPQMAMSVESNLIDVVLIPMLGFDSQGHRVGYGKGFYDRFLKECHPQVKKIGLSLLPIEDENFNDINVNDMPLDICITPDHVHHFS